MLCRSTAAGLMLTALLPGQAAAEDGAWDRITSIVASVEEGLDALWPDRLERDELSLRLGVGAAVGPDYLGSDDYRVRPIPRVELRYRDLVRLDTTKLRYNLVRTGRFRAGPLVNYRFGRGDGRNPALAGLGDISDTVELGGFFELAHRAVLLSGDVRQAVGAGQGTTARVTIGHGVYSDEMWRVGIGLRAHWGSARHTRTNFGITPEQAAASEAGLQVFEPGGGFTRVGLFVVARADLTDQWRLIGGLGASRLLGDAADSPLVADAGSPNQVYAGFGITYAF